MAGRRWRARDFAFAAAGGAAESRISGHATGCSGRACTRAGYACWWQ